MKRLSKVLLPALAGLALFAPGAAMAQPPGGGMPPGMMAKMNAWRQWRENNKHIAAITQTLMGFAEMEKDPKTALTKDQAKVVLAVMKEWRNKPVMSNDQAQEVNKKLTSKLTVAQLKKMSAAPQFGRGGGGFGGGSRAGGGGAGGRPQFDPSKFPDPKPYNPLNPDSSPFAKMNPEMSQRMKTRMNEFMTKLEAKAK